MRVIYSANAKAEIEQYREALKLAPYNKRPIDAYHMALAFKRRLRALEKFWDYRICESKVLGQKFQNNRPLFKNLRQINYRSFSISFFVDLKRKTIIINEIYNSSGIKDWKERDLTALSEFHSWMQRLDEVKGARPTYWCK